MYDGTQVRVSNLQHLAGLLTSLLPRSDCCIVRGGLVGGKRAEGIRRLLHTQPDGTAPTLREVPHRWLALDIDDLPCPDDFDRRDIAACAEAAVEVLPPAFRHANCVALATGSHALKPGIRMRLWYWLCRPMGGGELRAWLRNASVDDSLFSPAQPCYTASPTFDYPRIDHLPHRLVELPGEEFVFPPSPEELAPPEPVKADIIRLDRQTSETADRYVTGALDLAALNVLTAPTGRRHRTIVREACCLARYIANGHLSAGEVRAVLTEAARRNGKDDDAELQAAIDWGLGNPNTRTIPEDLRRAS